MNFLIQIITWVNVPMNAVSGLFSGFMATLPGWLSNTIIAVVAGPILMLIFKYTSNQDAIGRARDSIKANMLALKLYKDSLAVTILSQGRVFIAAMLLFVHSLRPMLVMIVPVALLLAQMGLWYELRPLEPGEKTIITMKLNGSPTSPLPDVTIEPTDALEVTIGPIRTPPRRQIVWEVKAGSPGKHNIVFNVAQRRIQKQLDIGTGFMRISPKRPGSSFTDIFLYPSEKPFTPGSTVQSITIEYPGRVSLTSGATWWMIYFFVVSMVVALIFKPVFKVKI